MELFVIAALIIGVAWFAVPRLSRARRKAEDDAYASGGFGMGMLSWLPAWVIIGGAMHDDGTHGADAGAPGRDAGAGADWSGSVGGDSGHLSGGGDIGGGSFGGQ